MTIEEIVRLILRLWLAGTMNIGLLLGQVGPFLLTVIGFGGWVAFQRKEQLGSPDAHDDSSSPQVFILR